MQRILGRCSCSTSTASLPQWSAALSRPVAGRSLATHASSTPADSAVAPSTSTSSSDPKSVPRIRKKLSLLDIESSARRAPSPVPASEASRAQTIYLPNIVFRLVRNGPNERNNPFIATFRVPAQLTKPDIVSYLAQVYGLKVTSISTITEMGDIVKRQPGTYKSERRKKQTKKAIVGMEEPFWFPEKRSEAWLNENFEKDARKKSLARRLMSVGDGGPGRGRRSWRWRGTDPTQQGVGARYSSILQRIQERRATQEQIVRNLAEKEKSALVQQLEKASIAGPAAE